MLEQFRSFHRPERGARASALSRMGLRPTKCHETQGRTGGFACRRDQRRQRIAQARFTLSPALVPRRCFNGAADLPVGADHRSMPIHDARRVD